MMESRRIPSWLSETFRVWLQYLAVVIAAFPAGVVCFLLIGAGLNETLAYVISATVCLGAAYPIWKALSRLVPKREEAASYFISAVTISGQSVETFNARPYAPAWSTAILIVGVATISPHPPRIGTPDQTDTTCSSAPFTKATL